MTSEPFPSRWKTQCSRCGDRISKNDEIRLTDEDKVIGMDCEGMCGFEETSER